MAGLMKLRKARLASAIVLPAVLATGVYAFTAASTVPATKAGDGNGAITGYTVTNVHYVLNGADPTKIDSVTFDVNVAPVAGSTIKIKLVAAGAVWYTCTNVTTAVTCDTTVGTQATVVASDDLRVIVAQ